MAQAPTEAAGVVRRLATKLGVRQIVVAGPAGDAAAQGLGSDLDVGERLADAQNALVLVDVTRAPDDALTAAAAEAAAVVLLAGDDASPDAADAWSTVGEPAWRGATSGTPSVVAVRTRAGDARAAALLAGGPHGLALDAGEAGDLEVLGSEPDLAGVRVAVLSYELVGLTRTGGIGTAYTALAHALARAGAQVDVLFTGWPAPGVDVDAAIARHAQDGVRVQLLDVDQPNAIVSPSEHERRAYLALDWLRAQAPYAIVHAPECAGHGAAIAAAKRAGEAFPESEIVIGTHGSSRWVKDVNDEPFVSPDQLTMDVLERRSVQDADVVVSPSAYLIDDMVSRGWRLPERTFVQQYVLPPAAEETAPAPDGPLTELVFFGRWEARKGFPLLLDALDRLVDRIGPEDLTVTFLGRPDFIDGVRADDLLARRRTAWPWPVQTLTDLDQPEALDYLRGRGRLAVMPSLADNLPLTVLEGLALGIPFVTCATGGIPEMIAAEDLARCATEPEPGALADTLAAALAAPPHPPRFAVDPAVNREAHLRWHRALADRGPVGRPPMDVAEPAVVRLGEEGLPDGAAEHVLLLSHRQAIDEGATRRLVAAAASSGADIITFAVRDADGRTIPPLGGGPALAPVTRVLSTGSALVRRALVDAVPADEPALEALIARLALDGARVLVVGDPLATVDAGPDPWPTGALLAWWPTAEQLAHAHAAARAFAPALPDGAQDLPALASLLGTQGAVLRAERDRAEALTRESTAAWKDADRVLARRDQELADTVVALRRVETELATERKRLETLRNRRVVKVALAAAAVKRRLRR